MKKAILFIWFLGTGLTLNCQHRHISADDSFTRQYIKRHYDTKEEVRLFNRSWPRIIKTYILTASFSNRLSSITSFDFHTNDPEEVLAEYDSKIDQLNSSYAQQQEANNERIDASIRALGDLVADVASDKKITTNNALADWLIKEVAIGTVQEKVKQKNAENLELQRRELQATLDANLSTEMSQIRDQMLSENSQLMDKYLEAMAFEADYSKERYYGSCYDYYECFSKQIRSDYSYNSSSWYKPNCNTPVEENSATGNVSDYIDIAYRKLDLYKKYNNEIFLKGTNIFLDAGLAENNQNPKAYFLKAQLENDIINKMFFTQLAYTYDSGNNLNKRELYEITNSFNDEFFLAIRNADIDFISKSIEKGLHLGREKNGRSAIETAIDFDKAKILEMLINATPEEKNTLSENGNSLLFHACAVNALEVVKKLISLGVNPEFRDKNYSGLTALNIAERNNCDDVFLYLASNYDIKPALMFAKKNGADDFEKLSSKIHEIVPSKIDEIGSVNSESIKKYADTSPSKKDSENSGEENNLAQSTAESPNLISKNRAFNLEKDQKSNFLEYDSVNAVKTGISKVEKLANTKNTKPLPTTSDLLNSQKINTDSDSGKLYKSNYGSSTEKVRVFVTDFYNSPLTNISVFLFSGAQVQMRITDNFGEVIFDAFPRDIIKVAIVDLSGSNKYGTLARKGYTEMLSNLHLKIPRYPVSSSEAASMLDELVSILLDAPDVKEALTKLKEDHSIGMPISFPGATLDDTAVFTVTTTIKDGKAGFILDGILVNYLKGNLNCESVRYGLNYYYGNGKDY